ncbi:MAG TPA: maleylpyruvate isomerase N-terminal domain-containing protein [Acidimicrobiales bacterium]|nr:maleylpyruvate isomerase N-terminal domain-containing protein [Acidimicrobiales bacterium]
MDTHLLSTAAGDGRALLVAAESDWDRPIPHCPAWDAAGLVRHTGGIYEWMTAIATARDRVSRRTLDPPPDDRAELAAWYLAALDRTIDVLGSADPTSETWTFSTTGDRRVGWWWRRLAVEVAIHRYDAESAASLDRDGPLPEPVDGDVAAAGVEEFVVEFLPGLLASESVDRLEGSLHLHATDGLLDWWVDLGDPGAARAEKATADTAIRATRSDLLLWLCNRAPLGSLEVIGAQGIASSWARLNR